MNTEPLTLSHREMRELLGLSKTEFYRLKKAGAFDHLEAPIRNKYSRERVEAWIARRGSSRPWARSA